MSGTRGYEMDKRPTTRKFYAKSEEFILLGDSEKHKTQIIYTNWKKYDSKQRC